MTRLFERIYDFLSRRRRLALLTVVALMASCAVMALRMDYDEDISAFMPMDAETAKYAEVFSNIGGQSKIAVTFKGGDTAAIEDAMSQFGKSMARRDTSHLARNLQVQVDEQAMLGVMQSIWQNYPLQLTDADYLRLDSILTAPDGIKSQMEQSKMMLMLPTGGVVAQSLPYDPLHLSGGVATRLRGLNVGDSYQTIDGYLFKDGVGIVLLESPFGISESHDNLRLQQLIDDCIGDVKAKNPKISVSAVGAPLIAVANAQQIKTDSLLALALAVVLIALVLVYAFRRSVGSLVWVAVSVFVGWLFALGVISLLRDSISIIVIGIGSVIIGIAVNYPLHFINHLRHERNMREALKEMVPPLLVGNITTVAAFLCLVFLDSRAMQDLGLFGSLTLVGTILFVLVCLPLFVKPKDKPVGRELPFGRLQLGGNRHVRRAMPWIVAALTAVFGYFSLGTSFDSNMQNINYMLPEQREAMKFLADGGARQTIYAVAEGRTLDEALRRNEALTARIQKIDGIEKISGIAGLVPSDSLAKAREARWHAYWQKHGDALRRFGVEAEESGFSAEAFAPFMSMAFDDSGLQHDATSGDLYKMVGQNFVMHDDKGYKVVNFLQVAPDKAEAVKREVASVMPTGCFAFTSSDVGNHLAELLSDSFNYIGFACGFVVFAFLWLSFGSIELSLLSFLPLAVSWLWILGLMDIFGMQFNIVNIILATFIFGQGDDYTIFITEGLMYEYTTGKRRLAQYKNSVALSAIIMFIGIGTLIFSKHPAMRSLAEVAIVGMVTVVVMAYYLPPLIFHWMTHKHGRLRDYPVTLPRLAASAYAITFFMCGMFFVLLPYTVLIHRPLRRAWRGSEAFYHRLLQRVSHYVVRHVPGVRFKQAGNAKETFERPAVIICNHQSHLDLMAIMQLSPKVIVLTNDWVWRNPYYGAVIHTAEFYPVSNGFDHNFPMLKDLVGRGYSIVVFPEGTRTPDGNIHRFHKGAFTLAKALGIDILPVYLHGLYDVLPKHDFMLRRGSVTLEVGDRVKASEIADTDDRLLAQTMRQQYERKYAEMRARLETAEYKAPYEAYKRKYKVEL